MRETIEFRIPEEYARRFLRPTEGTRLNVVRKIELSVTDPRLEEFCAIYHQLISEGAFLFTAWIPHRRYSRNELESAEVLQFKATASVELGEDEYGTLYDESEVCPHCGAGALQVSELAMNTARIPKNKDAAKTLSGEVVVSHRFLDVVRRYQLTGLELKPVRHIGARDRGRASWYQLIVKSRSVQIDKKTKVGIDPFDDDIAGKYRCPEGHVIGLNVLSEAWITRASYDGSEFAETKQHIGDRRGLLRPEPIRIVSQRAFRQLRAERLKGLEFEVAHLV